MFRFFIEHPRLSLVISLIILIAGVIALRSLPVEKFPNLSPPVIEVRASYPGASAELVEDSVTTLLEQEINGVPGMVALDSVSGNDGRARLAVTFEVGSDIDQKSVLVQNRVQKALPRLPQSVRTEGVTVEAASSNMLVVVNLFAADPAAADAPDALLLSNYALLNVKDAIARVPGVGRVDLLGARDYGVRVWLDPDRLRGFGLTANDVSAAIEAQNLQLAGGRIGAAPSPADQRQQLTVLMPGRLGSVDEFAAIVVRVGDDGAVLRLRDVAELELGAQNYDVTTTLGGAPTASLVVYQLPGSNALATVAAIDAEMSRLAAGFPTGIAWRTTYDSTRVVAKSIDEMLSTLYVAIGLVMLVVFVFLGGVRPTLVPGVAVPVALIGTFALMAALGFSLNTLSLFGLILAIGIVVDDAILVVETTTRNIEEQGLQPKQAAIAAMDEVGGAVIASTLVLLAVFVPVAFIPGLTGRLFQQFALTISAAVCISTINALTLSPALCSLILAKPGTPPTRLAKAFARVFEPARRRYVGLVRVTLVRRALAPLILLAVVLATGGLTQVVPGGFVPSEDEGVLMMQVSLPPAASSNRTEALVQEVRAIASADEAVAEVITFSGYDVLSGTMAPNKAMLIVVLRDWSEREDPELQIGAVKARIDAATYELLDALVFSFQPPPIPGLGTTSGIELELQDRGGLGAQTLAEVAGELAINLRARPEIAYAASSFTTDEPQVRVRLDRDQTARIGVPLGSVQDTVVSNLAARYVDDVVLFGRTFRVMMSSRRGRIGAPEDLLELTSQGQGGALVPLGTFAEVELVTGPSFVTHYNLYPSARLTIVPRPGFSSAEAMTAVEAVAGASLGPDFGYEWSGQAREERDASGTTTMIFALSVVLVYLFLVAQYESFTAPISVLLMVPSAMFGAYLAQLWAGLPIDLYTQVGLVLLVGLTAKTAILLVELSKQRVDAGEDPAVAAEAAATLRFRAVLMTAGTFILGMVPLLTATGAGAASRVSLGGAVTGGTVAGIVFTLVLVPRLYVLIQSGVGKLGGRRDGTA
jgi:hydrophobic/amphiphilic exporter-1 (mainly G- bacteria), HAE1 family